MIVQKRINNTVILIVTNRDKIAVKGEEGTNIKNIISNLRTESINTIHIFFQQTLSGYSIRFIAWELYRIWCKNKDKRISINIHVGPKRCKHLDWVLPYVPMAGHIKVDRTQYITFSYKTDPSKYFCVGYMQSYPLFERLLLASANNYSFSDETAITFY